MNARTASREIALLSLFQLDKQGEDTVKEDQLKDLMLSAVRSLVENAKEELNDTAKMLQVVGDSILDHEHNHPENLEREIDAFDQPVELPNTQAFFEQIEKSLNQINILSETLRIPEVYALAHQKEVTDYACYLVKLVKENQSALDEEIDKYTEDWRISRLAKMDAYILRLALAEIKFEDDVDTSVSIDEAVELSKLFSSDDSYKFINGVLGAVADAYENIKGTATGV